MRDCENCGPQSYRIGFWKKVPWADSDPKAEFQELLIGARQRRGIGTIRRRVQTGGLEQGEVGISGLERGREVRGAVGGCGGEGWAE